MLVVFVYYAICKHSPHTLTMDPLIVHIPFINLTPQMKPCNSHPTLSTRKELKI